MKFSPASPSPSDLARHKTRSRCDAWRHRAPHRSHSLTLSAPDATRHATADRPNTPTTYSSNARGKTHSAHTHTRGHGSRSRCAPPSAGNGQLRTHTVNRQVASLQTYRAPRLHTPPRLSSAPYHHSVTSFCTRGGHHPDRCQNIGVARATWGRSTRKGYSCCRIRQQRWCACTWFFSAWPATPFYALTEVPSTAGATPFEKSSSSDPFWPTFSLMSCGLKGRPFGSRMPPSSGK